MRKNEEAFRKEKDRIFCCRRLLIFSLIRGHGAGAVHT
jgi:hypothetical protein